MVALDRRSQEPSMASTYGISVWVALSKIPCKASGTDLRFTVFFIEVGTR